MTSANDDDQLVAPHGGRLVDLMAAPARRAELRAESRDWPSWDLAPPQLGDLELLVNGGFSPLTGFLGQADAQSVVDSCRLTSGARWPTPVVLEVSEDLARSVAAGQFVALRDPEGTMVAALQVTEIWRPAPGQPWCLGGPVEGVAAPVHYDFQALRLTPAQVRAEFGRLGWRKVAAYPTDGFLHRAHVEGTQEACRREGANLLILASAGAGHYSRVRSYQAVLPLYPKGSALLSLLPVADRAVGVRGTLWRAIIAKNFGCRLLLVDPGDHGAGEHVDELGIDVIAWPGSLPASDAELGRILAEGGAVPEGVSYPDVVAELRRSHPRRHQQGFTVFFTGLSGSGKSTIANILATKLLEVGGRSVTLLDGDVVRKHLSSELGFSREHRDINIRRIGFVASEITKNGGIAICAPIAPYQAVREEVRAMIAGVGGFVLVAVDTALEVCEQRDRKGLYAKARAGILKEFTGISDPYEVPADAEVVIDTACLSAEEGADEIIRYLDGQGFLGRP
jgi:sulfate adenylyltransferase